MGELFFIPSRDRLDAKNNALLFVQFCKEHYDGSMEEWDKPLWPKARFFKLGCRSRTAKDASFILDGEYIDFAKAYFWFQVANHPKQYVAGIIMALRTLEKALLQVTGKGEIARCNSSVLDEAAVIARGHYSAETAYVVAAALKRLAEFISQKGLTQFQVLDWKSPIKYPGDLNTRIGEAAKRKRAEKLPNMEELHALAEIFASDPGAPRDIFTSAFCALLMCAPVRASEILALPVDAEIEQKDKDGIVRYGWRFYSVKGYEGNIKWIPKTMEGIAKTAFARIRKLTEPGRALARWLEEHPDKFYPHELSPRVAEDEVLTGVQAARALGFDVSHNDDAAPRLFARKLSTRKNILTLRRLWQHALSRQPEDMIWYDKHKGIKWRNALFCLLRNQLHIGKVTIPIELHKTSVSLINCDLGDKSGDSTYQTIFSRYGYKRADGSGMKFLTHQARHLLNTIAHRGGLPEDEIARWSGRKELKSNRVYNHLSGEEINADFKRIALGADQGNESLPVLLNQPVAYADFEGSRSSAVHVTEYGFCVHDFVISPCMKYRDCINCTEHVCIKGDEERLQRLRLRLEQMESVLALALEEAEEGALMADRWVSHHRMTIAHLKELIGLLTSENLPDQAVVRISGSDFSHMGRALAAQKSLP